MKTQSCLNGKFSRAQFFFFGQVPLNLNCMTLAPKDTATAWEPSILSESTIQISSAHCTLLRHLSRFLISFLIGIIIDTDTDICVKSKFNALFSYDIKVGYFICF